MRGQAADAGTDADADADAGVDIPGEDVPLGDASPAETGGLDLDQDLMENADENVPLDSTPQTGDNSRAGIWAGLLIVSLVGMAVMVLDRKRRSEFISTDTVLACLMDVPAPSFSGGRRVLRRENIFGQGRDRRYA